MKLLQYFVVPKLALQVRKRREKPPEKRAFIDKTIHRMDARQGFLFLLEGEVAACDGEKSIVQTHGGAGRGGGGRGR